MTLSRELNKLKNEGILSLYIDTRYGHVLDFSGNANDGTLTSSARLTKGGVLFPATTSHILVADDSTLQLTEGCLMFLGEITSQTNYEMLFSKRDAGGVNYELYLSSTRIEIYDGSVTRIVTKDMLNTNSLAVNIKLNEIPKLYVDGVFSSNFNGTLSALSVDDAPLRLGDSYTGNNLHSKGGAWLVFSRQLTDGEIARVTSELNQFKGHIARSKAFDIHGAVYGDGTSNKKTVSYGDILDMGTDDMCIECKMYIPVNAVFETGLYLYGIAGKGYVGLNDSRYYTNIFDNKFSYAIQLDGTTFDLNAAGKSFSIDPFRGKVATLTFDIDRSGNAVLTVTAEDGTTNSGSIDVSAKEAYNANAALNFEIGGTSEGVYTQPANPCKIWDVKVYRNNVLEFYAPCRNDATLTDQINNITPTLDRSVFKFDTIQELQIPYKGERGIIANETTISSGSLENTGLELSTGTHQIVTQKNSGLIEKILKCITRGFVECPFGKSYNWTGTYSDGSAFLGNNVINGTFDTDTDWIKAPTGATISGGIANLNLNGDTYIFQDILKAGTTYELTFDYNLRSGGFYVGLNGGTGDEVVTFSTIKQETITVTFTPASGTRFIFRRFGSGTLDVDIDNVVLKAKDRFILDAGDELILASEDPKRSLYQKI